MLFLLLFGNGRPIAIGAATLFARTQNFVRPRLRLHIRPEKQHFCTAARLTKWRELIALRAARPIFYRSFGIWRFAFSFGPPKRRFSWFAGSYRVGLMATTAKSRREGVQGNFSSPGAKYPRVPRNYWLTHVGVSSECHRKGRKSCFPVLARRKPCPLHPPPPKR